MWLEKLKQMKKNSGKTSQQISDETGIPKSTIDKLFAGNTKEPYLSSTRLIVHCLGYTLDDLDDISSANAFLSCVEEQLINKFRKLNDIGRKKLIEYANDLIDSGNYSDTVAVLEIARTADNHPSIKETNVSNKDLEIFETAPQSDEDI